MSFRWIGKSEDGRSVTLKRLEPRHFVFPGYFDAAWEAAHPDQVGVGAALDVETTGLSFEEDRIIEIGVRPFQFNRRTGEVLSFLPAYSSFQDPARPLSAEIQALTGITDAMVRGQNIDWNRANETLARAEIVIAHNAGFDRPFVDQLSSVSREKVWACSLKQIDWAQNGFASSKLELLNIYHGFFTDSHRALNDADALLYLLSLKSATRATPYLLELLHNSKKDWVHVIASQSPFESKELLKARRYHWDSQNRHWCKKIEKESLESEIEWLERSVYLGEFRGRHVEIKVNDHFK